MRLAVVTKMLPGPAMTSTGAMVCVPKAKAATAHALPARMMSVMPRMWAAASRCGLRVPSGRGGEATVMLVTPAT